MSYQWFDSCCQCFYTWEKVDQNVALSVVLFLIVTGSSSECVCVYGSVSSQP